MVPNGGEDRNAWEVLLHHPHHSGCTTQVEPLGLKIQVMSRVVTSQKNHVNVLEFDYNVTLRNGISVGKYLVVIPYVLKHVFHGPLWYVTYILSPVIRTILSSYGHAR